MLANTQFIQPNSIFSVAWTAQMIFMTLVGGLGTFEGPIVGALILFLIQDQFGNGGVWYLVALGLSAILWIRDDMNSILIPGRTLRGLVEGDSIPQLFIPRLVEPRKQGRFRVERIVATYDFEAIDQAVHDAEAGVVIKPVLRMA